MDREDGGVAVSEMDAEAKVKMLYRDAYAKEKKFRSGLVWCVFSLQANALLGRAKTESTAWLDAASRMDAREQAPMTDDSEATCAHCGQGIRTLHASTAWVHTATHKFKCELNAKPAQEEAGARDGGADADYPPALGEHVFGGIHNEQSVTCSCGWQWDAVGHGIDTDFIQAWGNHRAKRDLSARQAECERLRAVLREHHEWQVTYGQAEGHGYINSALYIRTRAALAQEAQ